MSKPRLKSAAAVYVRLVSSRLPMGGHLIFQREGHMKLIAAAVIASLVLISIGLFLRAHVAHLVDATEVQSKQGYTYRVDCIEGFEYLWRLGHLTPRFDADGRPKRCQ